MDDRSKAEAYNSVIRALNDNNSVINIKMDKKNGYDFTCTVMGKLDLFFNLRRGMDIAIIKTEMTKSNAEDNELNILGQNLTVDNNISYTAYDDKLVLQNIIPLGNLENEEAKEKILAETEKYVDFLLKNEEVFKEMNPIIVEEAERSTNSSKDKTEPENILENTQSKQENNVIVNDETNSKNEENKKDKLKNLNKEKNDISNDKLVNKKDNWKNKEKNNKPAYKDKAKENKAFINTEKKDKFNSYNVEESLTASKNENNKSTKNDNSNREKEPNNKVSVSYQRAPEVEEQMHQLYKEMNEIFNERKEQADYRSKTLDGYAKRLELKEQELINREQELNDKYLDMQKEMEEELSKLAIEKDDMDFQINKLQMEKDNIEAQKKDIKEQQELLRKSNTLIVDIPDNKELNELRKENDELKDKIIKLQNRNKELSKNVKEPNNNLSDDLKITKDELKKANAKIEELNKISESSKETQNIIINLQESLRSSNEEIEKRKNAYELEKEEKNVLKEKFLEITDVDKIGKIIEYDDKIKTMNIVKSEEEVGKYSGTISNCKIEIYIKDHIIKITKDVRRGLKYQKNINKWNDENIKSMFTYTDKQVICKSTYMYITEITDFINETIDKFKELM